jgi:hypothetical protein
VILLAGNDAQAAGDLLAGVAEEAPGKQVMATDPLVRVLDPAALPARVRDRLGGYAVVSGSDIEEPFRERFGRPPGRYAALGYDAMRTVLDSIDAAGSRAHSREAVIEALRAAMPSPVSVEREPSLSR